MKRFTKKRKAIATVYSIIIYLFITIAIIGLVTNFAIDFINDQQENYKYEVTLDEINNMHNNIINVANNKNNVNKISINNPEYLEIDCNSNIIKGYINYNKKYKDNRVVVDGITTYKKLNKIYFEKPIGIDNLVNLNCRNLVLNKGRNNLNIQYFNYDSEDNVVNVDVFRSKSSRSNNWYNSNWLYRNKIDINKDLVDGNLEDFPILIESEDFSLLEYSKDDGSDIVFTLGDGKTKLYREIEDYNSQELPYYIEEESVDNYKVWSKVDLKANSTKTIYLKKEEKVNSPNGDEVFDFFDDFDSNTLDTSKWNTFGTDYGSITTSNGELTVSNTSADEDNYIGVYSTNNYMSFDKILHTKSKITSFRHSTLIGFADDPFGPFPHGDASTNGTSWYGRADNQTSTISYRSSTYSGNANSMSHDPREYLTYDIKKISTNLITYYKEGTLEYSLENSDQIYNGDLPIYFSADGWGNPDTLMVDYIFIRKYAENEPILNIEEIENDLYKIDITNTNEEELTNYQVKIPGDLINIESKTDSLKLYSGKLTAWVKIPKLSSNEDQFIYMYYGNDQGEETDSTKVWDDNYVMVQHLNESPDNDQANGFLDSTKYENNGVAKDFDNNVNSNVDVDSKINGASVFDGVNDRIEINNTLITNLDKYSISFWAKVNDNLTPNNMPVGCRSSSHTWYFQYNENNYEWYYIWSDLEDDKHSIHSNEGIDLGKWTKIDAANDGNAGYIYINGIKQDDYEIGDGFNNSSLIINIGTYLNDLYPFPGFIDEVQVLNSVKTTGWIKTEYNNQSNVNNFININNMERI